MLNDFLNYIKDTCLVKKSDRILLAVSGGIDSMAMTHLFIKAGFSIGIAHCNFSLRGNESDLDEELVTKFAFKNKIPFFTTRFDTEGYAKKNGISIEMAARDLRYEWFNRVMKEEGFDKTAVAHNMNDNIETLILNLTRGTGVAGLTGMKASGKTIIRPLLFATRKTIEQYCAKNHIKYREDKSNADVKFKRNKIRHQIIPVLKEINTAIELTLNETAERLSEINDIVSSYIDSIRKELFHKKNKTLICGTQHLKEYLKNRTVIYELFRPYGITGRNLADLYSIIEGRTGSYVVTESHRILRNRNEVIITVNSPGRNDFFRAGNLTELRKLPVISSVKTISISAGFKIPGNPFIAFLDFERFIFPVIIRKWKAGDIFYPLGMNKRKKLSDYFIDRKYSMVDKENILILESSGKIIWLIGDRIDNRFRITDKTRKVVVIKAAI
jgi:tRNA(Ile)-lysidine synthase